MGSLTKNWEKESKDSLFRRLEERVHGTPLKEKIVQTSYRLKLILNRLEQANARMEHHDKELFEKCVAAAVSKDNLRAAMYANECAEVRKMAKVLLFSKLAIEQVMLRLETVQEFGDVMSDMAPVAGVIHALKGKLSGVIPEVSYELGSIGEMLNGIVAEAGQATGTTWSMESADPESRRILLEANSIAEQRMRERFPELPSSHQLHHAEREYL